jgi:hypothetical protein
LGSEILFVATGAARDRPPTGLGFGLAARGRGSRARPLLCLGVTHLRGCSSAVRDVARRRCHDIDTRRVVAWHC